ncbi:MAG: TatD family hydrolase [Sandaracinaceae bacterium]
MGLFDVHAHLTHPKLAPRQPEILANARAAGVTTVIANGLHPTDNEAVRALAAADPLVRPAFGFYPVDAVLQAMEARGVDYPRDAPAIDPAHGIAWVREHVDEAFAVGEIGLDGYWVPEELWPAQEEVFRALVKIAIDADKPIIIHTRKRERRALEVLTELGAPRVNWHCFGGRVKLARRIAEHGHYLSIPANARRNQAFTRMLETLPRDRILLETDCPYLGPERGADSEPAHVRSTAEYAAELWGAPVAEVEARLAANFAALFGARP